MHQIPDLGDAFLASDSGELTDAVEVEQACPVDQRPARRLAHGVDAGRSAQPVILARQLVVLGRGDEVEAAPSTVTCVEHSNPPRKKEANSQGPLMHGTPGLPR